ncbi:hypothetical protein MNV49_007518 [Pseudohyphozyma bogoriensis]|nr:hypothetical protein MNV49_007518 [Pseudohyphozyma bogoriensis]
MSLSARLAQATSAVKSIFSGSLVKRPLRDSEPSPDFLGSLGRYASDSEGEERPTKRHVPDTNPKTQRSFEPGTTNLPTSQQTKSQKKRQARLQKKATQLPSASTLAASVPAPTSTGTDTPSLNNGPLGDQQIRDLPFLDRHELKKLVTHARKNTIWVDFDQDLSTPDSAPAHVYDRDISARDAEARRLRDLCINRITGYACIAIKCPLCSDYSKKTLSTPQRSCSKAAEEHDVLFWKFPHAVQRMFPGYGDKVVAQFHWEAHDYFRCKGGCPPPSETDTRHRSAFQKTGNYIFRDREDGICRSGVEHHGIWPPQGHFNALSPTGGPIIYRVACLFQLAEPDIAAQQGDKFMSLGQETLFYTYWRSVASCFWAGLRVAMNPVINGVAMVVNLPVEFHYDGHDDPDSMTFGVCLGHNLKDGDMLLPDLGMRVQYKMGDVILFRARRLRHAVDDFEVGYLHREFSEVWRSGRPKEALDARKDPKKRTTFRNKVERAHLTRGGGHIDVNYLEESICSALSAPLALKQPDEQFESAP